MAAARRSPTRRLLRARRRLRAELAQLLCALVGLGLGLVLPRLTSEPSVAGSRLVLPLMTLGIGVIGLVSLVYSLLFGVVQWSATSFTPRLRMFRGDPLVWRTFAFAIGVFVYCATAALASADQSQVSVLVPGAAIVGVLAAVALIRQLQIRAFLSLQLAYVLEAVSTEGRAVIEDVYPVRATDQTRPLTHSRHRRRRCVEPSPGAVGRGSSSSSTCSTSSTPPPGPTPSSRSASESATPCTRAPHSPTSTAATYPTTWSNEQSSGAPNDPSTRTPCSPFASWRTSHCGRSLQPSTTRPPRSTPSTPATGSSAP